MHSKHWHDICSIIALCDGVNHKTLSLHDDDDFIHGASVFISITRHALPLAVVCAATPPCHAAVLTFHWPMPSCAVHTN